MTSPKFKVGQAVAVFVDLPEAQVSIPKTIVTGVERQVAGAYENPYGIRRGLRHDSWCYYVEDYCLGFFNERYLRPIDPDTEHLESHEDTEVSA